MNLAITGGWTPLLSAVACGHASTIAVLLESPLLEVNTQLPDGRTALRLAIEIENIDIIQRLLMRGAVISESELADVPHERGDIRSLLEGETQRRLGDSRWSVRQLGTWVSRIASGIISRGRGDV